jgi:hypothetical protein
MIESVLFENKTLYYEMEGVENGILSKQDRRIGGILCN